MSGELGAHDSEEQEASAPERWEGESNLLDPYLGMQFDTEQSARLFYNSYARRLGFSIRVSSYHRSPRDSSIISRQFVCSRQGFSPKPLTTDTTKRRRAVTRVGCKAQFVVKRQEDSGKWVLTKFVKDHNHDLVPPDKVHCLRSHRHMSGPARTLIDTLQAAGMGAARVMSVLIKESGGVSNVGFTKVDCQNYMSNNIIGKQRTLGSGGIVLVLEFLRKMRDQDPGFMYAFLGESEEDGIGDVVFWADSNARRNYGYFGDTVVFDTAYRTDRFRVPFAPFTGWNQHGQPVLFGCSLIVNESESSFVWLFQTWLAAMSERHPVSITTERDKVIRSAVSQVFPATRHRFCKWNIFLEAQQRLADVYNLQPTFELEFQMCVNESETVDEFEICWESLLKRYGLGDNEWLLAMYNCRQQWVPVYLRDTFFGEMSVMQGSEGLNSYFDGFINAATNIQSLIRQYERAIASRSEKEVKEDSQTLDIPPVFKTPSPMEKQVANLYTRRIFTKFQEELVETLAYSATVIDDEGPTVTYRVAKFGKDHKAHMVRFSVFEKKASCSCKMFEFSGIVCRHVLAVFRVANVLTLPSCYILKRWTRNAKSGVILDEHFINLSSESHNSFGTRFENLRREAIKFVEEGAETAEIFDVAINALREASRKVRAAKMHGSLPELSAMRNERQQLQLCCSDQDAEIQELNDQLRRVSERCEAYRAKLISLLKDMEESRIRISVKVQNERLNLKD